MHPAVNGFPGSVDAALRRRTRSRPRQVVVDLDEPVEVDGVVVVAAV
jgi:hypothetical protein